MPLALRVTRRLLYALYRKRFGLLIVVLLVAGGSAYLLLRSSFLNEAAATGVFPIEMSVQQVVQQQNNTFIVPLKEKNGNRRIALNVGDTEARVIAREQGMRVAGDSPQAYDLLRNVIETLDGRVDRVLIYDADQTQYQAHVVVSNHGESRTVKARPADAIALAVKVRAPVFVEDRVLDQFGIRSSGS